MYFWSYRLQKSWLDKCLNSPVSEDPSRTNKAKGTKQCSKLKDNTFNIFIDPRERNSGLKCLSKWYGKSEDCLLAHWLPITNILILIETIHSNIFRCNYLRNGIYFLSFFAFSQFTLIIILFLTETIYSNIFRSIYLSNKKYFLIFFWIF